MLEGSSDEGTAIHPLSLSPSLLNYESLATKLMGSTDSPISSLLERESSTALGLQKPMLPCGCTFKGNGSRYVVYLSQSAPTRNSCCRLMLDRGEKIRCPFSVL